MYCWKCGANNIDDARFCSMCGESLRNVGALSDAKRQAIADLSRLLRALALRMAKEQKAVAADPKLKPNAVPLVEKTDYQRQAQAYADAVIRAQSRQKYLDKLSRWRFLLGLRRSLGVGVLIGAALYIWHMIGWGEWFDTYNTSMFCVTGAFIVARQFMPSRKKVDTLEDAIESDIKNGLL